MVSRRDRSDGRQGGGIAAFALTSIAERISLVQSSDDAERFWLMAHTDQGPYLVGVWYRPPDPGECGTIATFKTEYAALETTSLGSIVLGDVNVHNKRWLKHSANNSPEGVALQTACDELGLSQKVSKPTRGDNLLDVVLTNIPGAKAKVSACIADHRLVTAEVPFKVPEQAAVARIVWQYAQADWEKMRDILENVEWAAMNTMTPDTAADYLSNTIISAAEQCIPKRTLQQKKSTHPWLTGEVEELVEAKRAAEGTPHEREAAEACSDGILKKFLEFTSTCAEKLQQLRAGSKGWWTKSRQLMDQKPRVCSIPALKHKDAWVFDPAEKANAFSDKFASKYALVDAEHNDYTDITDCAETQVGRGRG